MPTGFIGLGTIGRPIAQHLLDEGIDLVVWNRTASKADGLGATVAASPAAVADRCPVVILNLRDSDAVRAVLDGAEGLLSADLRGKTIIDTTTNSYNDVQRFHARVAEAGAAYLEAPVLGSVTPAAQGALGIFVSGARAAFDAARPLLETIGNRVEFFETPGLATALKLINNMVLGAFLGTLVEAILLGEAAGLSKERMIALLENGIGQSRVLSAKKQKLLDEDFTTHFAAALIHKDLAYAGELARHLERPLLSGDAAKAIYALTFLSGQADRDFSVIYDVLKGTTGERGDRPADLA